MTQTTIINQPNHTRGLLVFLLILPFSMCTNNQAPGIAPGTINLKAMIDLQFDVVRFKVKPGSNVTLSLTNVSDMSHNLLITKPGARLNVVDTALKLAEKGPQMDYIPETDDVLWSIPVVSPGQTKSVSFTAPAQPGVYPYVCTYPGHGFVMYGAMYVTTDEQLPEIKNDLNIPESRRQDDSTGSKEIGRAEHHAPASPHPYPLIPPYFYHAFIEGVGPAAIAVHLPNDLSYAWDADACRLSIAWKGEFIDMSDLWKGHFDASAKILGDIFFRDNTDYPIRMGNNASVPNVQFKGYRLVERYPEFHYALNGIDVYELIRPKSDSLGLIRNIRIPHADQTFWFYTNRRDDAIKYEFSAGQFGDRRLKLSASDAKEFTITMTSYYLAYKKKNE